MGRKTKKLLVMICMISVMIATMAMPAAAGWGEAIPHEWVE